MNVIDLREKLRRSPRKQRQVELSLDERRKAERRALAAESGQTESDVQRIWLTPGERTLIEDLYLLDEK
ncbi:hypothetical protein [Methyloglobulus sp.]|uniref:hypothetical protein n=1 Tax=Methyloglobulus sp. TaxID=2518622 RepID=UPI0032B704C0